MQEKRRGLEESCSLSLQKRIPRVFCCAVRIVAVSRSSMTPDAAVHLVIPASAYEQHIALTFNSKSKSEKRYNLEKE